MHIPPSFLETLRGRVQPSEIIKKDVALKSRAQGEYLGLCPFHKEKTPSFTVSDQKGFYHCFGCGAHGDVVKYLMEKDGLPFMEAVKHLSDVAGVEMPQMTQEQDRHYQKQLSYYDIMEQACSWYQQQLVAPTGQLARTYIQNRQISNELVAQFRLGYAPNIRGSLHKMFQAKGISDQDLLAVGLVVKNDRGEVYDRFRGRLIFPIIDVQGRVVAFGGRILEEGQPKYLNSPETVLFKKGEMLYNENLARRLAYKTGKLVVAEGYMDVIAMYGAGIKTAVAPLGTALTETQLKRLWNMTSEPVMCLDGDAAGSRAQERAAALALPLLSEGQTLKFSFLPPGLDPDDMIKAKGVESLRELLRNAVSLSDVLWNTELSKKPTATPEQQAELEKRLTALVARMKNSVVSNYYKNFFDRKLWNAFKKPASKSSKKRQGSTALHLNQPSAPVSESADIADRLLAFVLSQPKILNNPQIKEEFLTLEFSSNKLDKIRQVTLEIAGLHVDHSDLEERFIAEGLKSELAYLQSLQPTVPPKDNEKVWEYMLAGYTLSNMQREFRDLYQRKTEEAEKMALAMKTEIEQVEYRMKAMQRDFL
jgi:DNA primase